MLVILWAARAGKKLTSPGGHRARARSGAGLRVGVLRAWAIPREATTMLSMTTLLAATITLVLGPAFSIQFLAAWDVYARRQELRRWLAQRGLPPR